MDIDSLVEVESLADIDSLVDIGCCSASPRILVLSCIPMPGFELQPNLIASRAFLGLEVFLPFSG